VRIETAIGSPAREILKTAKRVGADLIVLGTHGLTGPDRLVLGSTTLNVLRRSVVPVLAVPPAAGRSTAKIPASWPGPLIGAAVDLNRRAASDVAIAVTIAHGYEASLLLVHVVRVLAAPAWVRGDVRALGDRRVALAQRRLEPLVEAARRVVPATVCVASGRPAEEIASVAASANVSLLVTALRDRQGWFGARRGSTSYDVVRHASAPVLAYPPRWRPR
jgi:nucleotide-binding universal stress UspA family protein